MFGCSWAPLRQREGGSISKMTDGFPGGEISQTEKSPPCNPTDILRSAKRKSPHPVTPLTSWAKTFKNRACTPDTCNFSGPFPRDQRTSPADSNKACFILRFGSISLSFSSPPAD